MKLVALALQMCFSDPRPVIFKWKNVFPFYVTSSDKIRLWGNKIR